MKTTRLLVQENYNHWQEDIYLYIYDLPVKLVLVLVAICL